MKPVTYLNELLKILPEIDDKQRLSQLANELEYLYGSIDADCRPLCREILIKVLDKLNQ